MTVLVGLFNTVLGANDSPPIIDDLAPDKPAPQVVGDVITWIANATDPDDGLMLYRFLLNDEAVTEWTADSTWIWTTSEDDVGSNRIEVQVRDGMHAGPNGLDDVRSAKFMINRRAMTKETRVISHVSLILNIINGDGSGSPIPGTRISGQDGLGNNIQENADINGVVSLIGNSGNWTLTASAEGFESISWSREIHSNFTKDIFLQKAQPKDESSKIALIFYLHEGSPSGPILPGAQVVIQDGSGNKFHETADIGGVVTLKGDPGAWSFTASAAGYETNSWSQRIIDAGTKHIFLIRMQSKNNENLERIQLSGSTFKEYNSIINSNLWNDRWTARGSGRMGRPAKHL